MKREYLLMWSFFSLILLPVLLKLDCCSRLNGGPSKRYVPRTVTVRGSGVFTGLIKDL